MASVLSLEPSCHLLGVKREYHTRKRGDLGPVLYITYDRDREYLLASQRLRQIAEFINERIACDKHNRVSVPGMFDMVDAENRDNDGWVKGRWKTTAIQLQKSMDVIQGARPLYNHAFIIGDPRCYHVRG